MRPSQMRKRIARLQKYILLLKAQRSKAPREFRYLYTNGIEDVRDEILNTKEELRDELADRKAAR